MSQIEAGFTCRALWALRDSDLDSADWKVAVALISCCTPLNGSTSEGVGRPSLGRIAAVARTSRAGVRRSLSRLEAGAGPLLVRIERGRVTADGDSDSHRYTVTLIAGCDQAYPTPDQPVSTCDQADPTPDQPGPTVGPGTTHGCDQAPPTGVTTQAHFEDLSGGSQRGSKRKPKKATNKTLLPNNFSLTEAHLQHAHSKGYPEWWARNRFEAFVDAAGAKGFEYVNWDLALYGSWRREMFDWGNTPEKLAHLAPRTPSPNTPSDLAKEKTRQEEEFSAQHRAEVVAAAAKLAKGGVDPRHPGRLFNG